MLPSTMPSFAGIEYISDMCWFVTVYLLVGVWKTAVGFKSRVNAVICFALAALLYAILVCGKGCSTTAWICDYWLWNIRTLPNALIACLIFVGVCNSPQLSSNLVNRLSAGMFAVYIVHQTWAFRSLLWMKICRGDIIAKMCPSEATVCVIAIAIVLTVVISIADSIRQKFIERPLLSSTLSVALIKKIDSIFSDELLKKENCLKK